MKTKMRRNYKKKISENMAGNGENIEKRKKK